ncbi:MAG: hypothetical protein IT193_17820 [Propionibacteriaceae bacterium]|nr:hypothetical protein [Propionibacteriaceae bacterium]
MTSRSVTFAREQLRSPFSVVLLVAVPVMFVLVADEVLAQFSTALGGDLQGRVATVLAAGWSAAFVDPASFASPHG